MAKRNWEKLQEFAEENKDILIMFACPKDDAILVSFNGLNGFVKFPKPESIDKGVIFNALRKSKFNEAIDAFMTGFTEVTGMSLDEQNGLQVAHVLGGSIKNIGIEKAKQGRKILEVIDNDKQNGKK